MKGYGLSFTFLLALSQCSYAAANLELVGKVPTTIKSHHHGLKGETKQVSLQGITMSDQAKSYIQSQLNNVTVQAVKSDEFPNKFDLGMRDIPAYDQGVHATAVTFAVSAALDASTPVKHPNPDYFVSEVCNLQLGNYLHQRDPAYPSGWDGSWPTVVLGQIKQHGIIMQRYQRVPGCEGVTEYPLNDAANKGKVMSADSFRQLAQNPYKYISWKSIFNIDEAVKTKQQSSDVITNIKSALYVDGGSYYGSRPIITYLVDSEVGDAGALGTYQTPNDSWVLTPQIEQDVKDGKVHASHTAVIRGFDDDAEVIAADGTRHKGIVKLRNSWGDAGDNGDYYMSYDYLRKLSLDVIDIIIP